jgi:hypothetical protein
MSAMRRLLLVATAAVVWIGVAAAPASAHSVSGVSGTNFKTTLQSVTPPLPGLTVKVVEAGSRLEVENRTGQELTVLGYKGEPYLRIGPDGVYENRLSPATYLNKSRKGGTPTEAAEKAKVGDTDWAKVSSEPLARWHDHRIHWMGNINPPEVRNSPDSRHVIKMNATEPQWAIPMRLASQDVVAKGDLVWEPGPSPLPWFALILVSLAVVVVIGRSAVAASGLAAVMAVLLAIDVFHVVGLGLANAGTIGSRLTKSITQSPYEPVAWVIAILAIVWLRRGRKDGLSLAIVAGLQIALLGGIGDLNALSRTVVPFGFGANLARVAVALSAGLGFGIAVVAVMHLAGVRGAVRTRSAALPDDGLATQTGA